MDQERIVLWVRAFHREVSQRTPPLASTSRGGRAATDLPSRQEPTLPLHTRRAETITRAGGQVHAHLAGQLLASFASTDARAVIELALSMLQSEEEGALAVALTLSTLRREPLAVLGTAIDDAFLLASRAHPGELLVDASVRDRVHSEFLFTRQVTAGGLRAASLDRVHPRRADCVKSLSLLQKPALPTPTRALVASLAEVLGGDAGLAIVEGPIGAGAAPLFEAVREALKIDRVLALGAAPGSHVPLSSLRQALLGRVRGPRAEALQTRELISKSDAVALTEEALELGFREGLVWVVLNPLVAIDHATLAVVEALRVKHPASMRIVGRLPLDALVPPPLGPVDVRFTLPALRLADARELVHAILGGRASSDVERRLSIMGGDTVLGCEEAVRYLVASGELVFRAGNFEWRTQARGGPDSVAVDELMRLRYELLLDTARRALQVALLAPSELLSAVAEKDGLDASTLEAALAVLRAEHWLDMDDPLTTHFVRKFTLDAMPPARRAELSRFIYAALPETGVHRLARAHYAHEGGLDDDALRESSVRDAALLAAGFDPPVALASKDADSGETELDPSDVIDLGPKSDQTLNGELTSPLDALLAGSPHGEVDGPDPRALRAAIRAKDVPAIDRWIERAIAEGSDATAIARMRVVTDVLRGDVANAQARLSRTLRTDDPRAHLAQAMVMLGGGRYEEAVRAALHALAAARHRNDAKGRSAAYLALAASYRGLGRPTDAALLERRVEG